LPALLDVLCSALGIVACSVLSPSSPVSTGGGGLVGAPTEPRSSARLANPPTTEAQLEQPGPSRASAPRRTVATSAEPASATTSHERSAGATSVEPDRCRFDVDSTAPSKVSAGATRAGTSAEPDVRRFDVDSPVAESLSGGRWTVVASAGVGPPRRPDEVGGLAFPIGSGGALLVVRSGPDRRPRSPVLPAVADQLAVALERRELQARAAEAAAIAEADRLRVGLLRSVSHDLRSPLSVIKANVTTLQRRDVHWDPAEVAELLAAVDRECDRLDRVVVNLLDASRLQAGELRLHLRPTALESVIATAASHARAAPGRLQVDAEPTVPLALADAELLERAVANVISNALAWSPPARPVRVVADRSGEEVVLRVVDAGPGIPAAQRARVLQPFQRLGDRSRDTGAGLGLAIASGFVTTMGGRFSLDDTPGGGLTVTITLPEAANETPLAGPSHDSSRLTSAPVPLPARTPPLPALSPATALPTPPVARPGEGT
jgi:signal transduction histidine kinase